jgi:hypothetical protein
MAVAVAVAADPGADPAVIGADPAVYRPVPPGGPAKPHR